MAAGAAGGIDAQPDAVLIVINKQFAHGLHESAGGALVPDGLAAAAEIMRFTGLDGFRQCLGVHVAMHQQFAGCVVGRDGRDQAVFVEFGRKFGAFFDLFDGLSFTKDCRGIHVGSLR